MVTLDVGCGKSKKGDVGMDFYPGPEVDVVWDMSRTPWPFKSETFETVFATHVLEHIPWSLEPQYEDALFRVMVEIHRVLKLGGKLILVTPHQESRYAWGVPTHRRVFNETTWTHFSRDLWTGVYSLESPEGIGREPLFARSVIRVDREFGSVHPRGMREWHVEHYLPRFYRFLCALRIGRKRNLYVELTKAG
jgi:SAM-dependent methyltransferase